MRYFPGILVIFAVGCANAQTAAAPARTYGAFGLVPADGVPPACTAQLVDPTTCKSSADAGSGDATAMGGDTTSTGGDTAPEFGPTHKGGDADDDDCKYHVTWLSTGATPSEDVYFQVDVTLKTTGGPATHVVATDNPIVAEVFVDTGDPLTNHPAPNAGQASSETATPGRYVVGPVRFDETARWTVRFHLYGDCDDGDTSPHGHAAFFFDAK